MMVGAPQLPAVHGDMETQIHLIEQEAYYSVIRAFKAQSDAISWVIFSALHCHIILLSSSYFIYVFIYLFILCDGDLTRCLYYNFGLHRKRKV